MSFSGSMKAIANLELLPAFLGLGVIDSGETLKQYLPFLSSSSAWPGAPCAAGDSSSCYLYPKKNTRGNCWQGLKAHAVPPLLISWHLWWLWGPKAPSLKAADCSSCFQDGLERLEHRVASDADTESKSKPLGSELGPHSAWESLVLPPALPSWMQETAGSPAGGAMGRTASLELHQIIFSSHFSLAFTKESC